MSKTELPKCPYCEKKVSFSRSGYLMSKPDYKCEACEKVSSVSVSHGIYGLIRIQGLIFAIAMIIFAFFGRLRSYFVVEIMFLTELVCYLLAPFYAKLSKKEDIEVHEVEEAKDKTEN